MLFRSMEESYSIEEAEGRGRGERESLGVKRSTLKFMADLIKLFQRMYQLKKEGKSGDKKKPAKPIEKPVAEKPTTGTEPKQESVKKIDPLLTEEINKIKNLMFRIN